jgi:hypothetical protein
MESPDAICYWQPGEANASFRETVDSAIFSGTVTSQLLASNQRPPSPLVSARRDAPSPQFALLPALGNVTTAYSPDMYYVLSESNDVSQVDPITGRARKLDVNGVARLRIPFHHDRSPERTF